MEASEFETRYTKRVLHRVQSMCLSTFTSRSLLLSRTTLLGVVLFATLPSLAVQRLLGQEPSNTSPTARYSLTFLEYQIPDQEEQPTSETELIKIIRDKKLKPSMTVMMSVVESSEAMVSFGQEISVITGVSQRPGGQATYNAVNRQVGTTVKAMVFQKEQELLVELDFESTQQLPTKMVEDAPKIGRSTPRVSTTSVSCIQIVVLGKPALLASSSRGTPTYLMLKAELIKN